MSLIKFLIILGPLMFKLLISTLDYATCRGVRMGIIKICVDEDKDLDTAVSSLATISLPRRFPKLRREHLKVILLHELLHIKYGHYIWPELTLATLLVPLMWLPTWMLSILMVMLLSIFEPVMLEVAEIHVRKVSARILATSCG